MSNVLEFCNAGQSLRCAHCGARVELPDYFPICDLCEQGGHTSDLRAGERCPACLRDDPDPPSGGGHKLTLKPQLKKAA